MHHTCTSTFQRGQSVPGTNRSNVKVLSAGTIGGGHLCSSRHTIRTHGCPCRPVRAYYLRSGVLVGPCLTANTRTVNAGCLSLDSRATKRGLQILDSTLLVPSSYPLVYLLVAGQSWCTTTSQIVLTHGARYKYLEDTTNRFFVSTGRKLQAASDLFRHAQARTCTVDSSRVGDNHMLPCTDSSVSQLEDSISRAVTEPGKVSVA